MTMMPSDPTTAQAPCSRVPTKYRLSKTLTGSAYHRSRGGVCRGAAGRGSRAARGPLARAVAAGAAAGSGQMRL